MGAANKMDSDLLSRVASERQKDYLDAYMKYKSVRAAAEMLGVSHQTISQALRRLRAKISGESKAQIKKAGSEKWLIIPDPQIRPGVDMRFMYCIGRYILDKRPDGVLCLGDMADMPSLSSYDKGKRSYEGLRYKTDIEAVVTAQKLLWKPVNDYNASVSPHRRYIPKKVFLEGNHEERGKRATQLDPMLHGTIDTLKDLKLHEFWDHVHEFMKVVVINGVAFCHYFGTGLLNKPCSTAQQQLRKMHMSCIAGHQQGRQTFTERAADGRLLTSIIAGSSYDYHMDYLGAQGNKHWRGILMLHNMREGEFDEVYIPTHYLLEKYAKDLEPMYCAPDD